MSKPKTIVQIKIDYMDSQSIKDSERLKSRLENDGYTLIHTFAGLNRSTLTYRRFAN